MMMAVANANDEFMMVDIGVNGRISDGGVISNTKFGQALADNTLRIPEPAQLPNSQKILRFVFSGDDAFGMTENMMKLYPQAALNVERRIFNYRLNRARRVIENTLGFWSADLVYYTVQHTEDNSTVSRKGSNFLRKRQSRSYVTTHLVDSEDDLQAGVATDGSWRDGVNEITPLQPETHQIVLKQ